MVNSHEILFKQLPDYFRPIVEYQEILKTHGSAMDEMESCMYQVAANNYIPTCDEPTLAFWENLLEITVHAEDTLEIRRKRVLQKLGMTVPFSIGFLHDTLTGIFGPDGYELQVDAVTCTICLKIISDDPNTLKFFLDMLWDIIPAHLFCKFIQMFLRKYEMPLYFGAAGGYIGKIREEVDMRDEIHSNG